MGSAKTESQKEISAEEIADIDSLGDLRDLTNEECIEAAYSKAKEVWWEDKFSPPDTETESLPGESVEIEGTNYEIHPVDHGLNAPLMKPGSEIVESVQGEVEDVLSDNGEVYIEQDLKGQFDLESFDVTEIDDRSWADNQFDEYKEIDGLIGQSKTLGKVCLAVPLIAGIKGYEALTGNRVFDEEGYNGIYAREDIGELEVLKADMEARFLPTDLEEEYLWETDSEKAINLIERSNRMADYIFNVSDSEEVRAIVGGAHYPFVMDRLQEYKEGERNQEIEFDIYTVNLEPERPAAISLASGLISAYFLSQGEMRAAKAFGGISALSGTMAGVSYWASSTLKTVTNDMQNSQVPDSHLYAEGYIEE